MFCFLCYHYFRIDCGYEMIVCVYLQLLDMLKFYAGFEINEQTGEALTDTEMMIMHYDRITSLQVCVYCQLTTGNICMLSDYRYLYCQEIGLNLGVCMCVCVCDMHGLIGNARN